jgi:hypothetical protein
MATPVAGPGRHHVPESGTRPDDLAAGGWTTTACWWPGLFLRWKRVALVQVLPKIPWTKPAANIDYRTKGMLWRFAGRETPPMAATHLQHQADSEDTDAWLSGKVVVAG